MSRNGSNNYRAFARCDRAHETLSYILDGARPPPPPRRLPPRDQLEEQLAANRSAFITLAERVAVFAPSPEELQQLDDLRTTINLLERDIKEQIHA